MAGKEVAEIATEAVRIYLDFDVSMKEAIERAKEVYQNDLSRKGSRKS